MIRIALFNLAAVVVVGAAVSTVRAADWVIHPGTNVVRSMVHTQAQPGDTLTLADGIFFENLDLPAGDWTIRAANRGKAIIDASLADSSAIVMSGNLVLEGLEIRGGRGHVLPEDLGTRGGGAVCVIGTHFRSSFEATDCVFRNNELRGESDWDGGAILLYVNERAVIRDCLFEDNFASGDGSAVEIDGPTDLVMSGCVIKNAEHVSHRGIFGGPWSGAHRITGCSFHGPGIVAFPGGNVVVEDCVLDKVSSRFSDQFIGFDGVILCRNNLFIGSEGGGTLFTTLISTSEFRVIGNTFVNQDIGISTGTRLGVLLDSNIVYQSTGLLNVPSSKAVVSCSVFWPELLDDPFGTVVIEPTVVVADPKFCNGGKWELADESPCLPGNSPKECSSLIGARSACSETPVVRKSWGDVKRTFK